MLRSAAGLLGALAPLLLFTLGCEPKYDGPELVPVTGTVTRNGQPVAGASVVFTPAEGLVALGTTDDQGKFSLKTRAMDGAALGKHNVSVYKNTDAAAPAAALPDLSKLAVAPGDTGDTTKKFKPPDAATVATPTTSELPAKYAVPGSSGLTFNVTKEGPNDFLIDLPD